jgi:hypothetical protein
MRLSFHRFRLMAFPCALLMMAAAGEAKDKKNKPAPKDPQDQIEVVGHVPLNGEPVRRFLPTQHYSSYYLYAERDGGKNIALIDVTKEAQPRVLSDVSYGSDGASDTLFAVAGTAALVIENQGSTAQPAAPQSIRIMDLADPQHPKVAREFTDVTAIARDEQRGLIFIANAEGIWILRQTFAEDPEVQKWYTWHVLYDH